MSTIMQFDQGVLHSLFPDFPATPSPRLAWADAQRAAGMTTHQRRGQWRANMPGMPHAGHGETEMEAMEDCAANNGIRLHNEI